MFPFQSQYNGYGPGPQTPPHYYRQISPSGAYISGRGAYPPMSYAPPQILFQQYLPPSPPYQVLTYSQSPLSYPPSPMHHYPTSPLHHHHSPQGYPGSQQSASFLRNVSPIPFGSGPFPSSSRLPFPVPQFFPVQAPSFHTTSARTASAASVSPVLSVSAPRSPKLLWSSVPVPTRAKIPLPVGYCPGYRMEMDEKERKIDFTISQELDVFFKKVKIVENTHREAETKEKASDEEALEDFCMFERSHQMRSALPALLYKTSPIEQANLYRSMAETVQKERYPGWETRVEYYSNKALELENCVKKSTLGRAVLTSQNKELLARKQELIMHSRELNKSRTLDLNESLEKEIDGLTTEIINISNQISDNLAVIQREINSRKYESGKFHVKTERMRLQLEIENEEFINGSDFGELAKRLLKFKKADKYEIINYFTEALSWRINESAFIKQCATLLSTDGDYSKSIPFLMSIIRRNHHVDLMEIVIKAYAYLGRLDLVRECVKEFEAIANSDASVDLYDFYRLHFEIEASQGDLSIVEKYCKMFLALYSGYQQSYILVANFYLMQGHIQAAKETLYKGLDTGKQKSHALELIFEITEKEHLENGMKKAKELENLFSRGLRVLNDDQIHTILFKQIFFLNRLGKVNQALETIEFAYSKVNESKVWILSCIKASILASMGQHKAMSETLEQTEKFIDYKSAQKKDIFSSELHSLVGEDRLVPVSTPKMRKKNYWHINFFQILSELDKGNFEKAELLCYEICEYPKFKDNSRLRGLKLQFMNTSKNQDVTCAEIQKAIIDTKSAEPWIEAARMHMNPLSKCFDLYRAKKCLEKALLLTPQNCDIYIEMSRLSYLIKLKINELSKMHIVDPDYAEMEKELTPFNIERRVFWISNEYGNLWQTCDRGVLSNKIDVFRLASLEAIAMINKHKTLYINAFSQRSDLSVIDESLYNELTTALGYFADRLKGVRKQQAWLLNPNRLIDFVLAL